MTPDIDEYEDEEEYELYYDFDNPPDSEAFYEDEGYARGED